MQNFTHRDRPGQVCTIVDSPDPAWTPNDYTCTPPDVGMVKVRWSDDDSGELSWEYRAELRLTKSETPPD
ncbi:hypothetical protein [Gordonia sihwensis]|uniref:hypothetical protein n=1 Tax=Gordonia sihwensis TaxID=173559 RepID=UPI003D96F3DB